MRAPPIAALLLLTACTTTVAAPTPQHAIRFRSDTTVSAYFGAQRTRLDSIFLEFNATTLHGMGEPPLRDATLAPGSRVLRFLWLRSFNPAVAVRVMQSPAGCTLVTTVRTGDAYMLGPVDSTGVGDVLGPYPGTTLRRDSTELSDDTCNAIATRLDALGVATDQPHTPGGGPDGTHWVLERVDARGHGCLEAFTPDSVSKRAIWDAGMAFLTAAHARPTLPREFY